MTLDEIINCFSVRIDSSLRPNYVDLGQPVQQSQFIDDVELTWQTTAELTHN